MTRITELAEGIAKAFRGSARTEELASGPPLKNDPALVNRMADWAEELLGKQSVCRLDEGGMGSEDFASYTYEVPSAYLLLGAGTAAEDPRFGKPMHNPQVVFNEDILPKGAALYAACPQLLGKWKLFDNPCEGPAARKTFYGQSTFLFQAEGNWYLMLDHWIPENLQKSGYSILPVTFDGEGIMTVRWEPEWNGI